MIWALIATTKLEERTAIAGRVIGVQGSLSYGVPMVLPAERQCALAAFFVVRWE